MGTRNQDNEKREANRQQEEETVDVATCQGELCGRPLRVCLNHCHGPLNPKRAGGGACAGTSLLLFYSSDTILFV